MGKTYKAVEIAKPGTFRLVEKPVVGPGEEQVRIRVEACGVCHSDAGTVEGQLPGVVYPRVPGHEAIGRIEEVGRRVTTWKVGQRLTAGANRARPALYGTNRSGRRRCPRLLSSGGYRGSRAVGGLSLGAGSVPH
jgi:threonine dehydrogenase-like Zn-dependent dehydrogenase